MSFVLAGTGHRPHKLGGYGSHVFSRLIDLGVKCIEKYQPTKIISGMALGWDMALAQAAIKCKVPLLAAVPFKGQESIWPKESQDMYNELLAQATEIVVVSEGGYAPYKLIVRDYWMVDRADAMLALWNGSDGGTGTTVAYAKKSGRRIINVWDSWVKYAKKGAPAVPSASDSGAPAVPSASDSASAEGQSEQA